MGRRREDIVSLFVASAVCARSAVACAACALLFELTTIVNLSVGSQARNTAAILSFLEGSTSFSNTARLNERKPHPHLGWSRRGARPLLPARRGGRAWTGCASWPDIGRELGPQRGLLQRETHHVRVGEHRRGVALHEGEAGFGCCLGGRKF